MEEWIIYFKMLLNYKSVSLNPHSTEPLDQPSTCMILADAPTLVEVMANAIRTTRMGKVRDPDNLPAEILKLGPKVDDAILQSSRTLCWLCGTKQLGTRLRSTRSS
ncbi:unnamed protein product [Choristocarpus tenellus]